MADLDEPKQKSQLDIEVLMMPYKDGKFPKAYPDIKAYLAQRWKNKVEHGH